MGRPNLEEIPDNLESVDVSALIDMYFSPDDFGFLADEVEVVLSSNKDAGGSDDEIEGNSSSSLLSNKFVFYKPPTIPTEIIIPIDGHSLVLDLDSCSTQKTFASFFGLTIEDELRVTEFCETKRFCDFHEFERIIFPRSDIFGPEEYLDSLLNCSFDILLASSDTIEEFDEIIGLFALLLQERCLCDINLKSLANYISLNLPIGFSCSRLSWFSDYLPIRVDLAETIKNVLFSEKHSIGKLYLVDKISNIYNKSIYNILANQENKIDALYCGAVVETANKPNRLSLDVVMGRNGLMGSARKTLEELGKDHGLTRERIRQIESKAIKSFSFSSSARLLSWRLSVVGSALACGCGGHLNSFDQTLHELNPFYSDDTFTPMLRLTPDIQISEDGASFYLANMPCDVCSRLDFFATNLVEKDGCVNIDEIIDAIGCTLSCFGTTPSDETLSIIIKNKYYLHVVDCCLGTRANPKISALLRPSNQAGQIRAVMDEVRRPITADEVTEIISSKTGESIPKSAVLSYMSRPENDCLLWNRSTYILKEYAPYPEPLLKEVAQSIKATFLVNRVPILGVNGIFDIHALQLVAEGIDFPQALYSELRMLGDQELTLREYPWVCDSATINERTSFAKYFYSVVDNNGGVISDEHAEQLSSRVLTQSWQLGGLAEYSPFVINANGHWYDLDAMELDYASIEAVINEVAHHLKPGELISAKKVYVDYEGFFNRHGIKSYDILYRIVELLDGLLLKPSRMPHLIKEGSDIKRVSVRDAIRMYIENRDEPCTSEELYKVFVMERGIGKGSLAPSMFAGNGIIECNNDVFCSERLLGLSDAFIETFDSVVARLLLRATEVSKLFYQVHTVEAQFNELPIIEAFSWNGKLLQHVFKKSKCYHSVGQLKNCIVDLKAHPDITNDEDFYAAIIESHFNGWSTFDDFTDYCKMYGIASDLGPEFFDAYEKIIATEYSIRVES